MPDYTTFEVGSSRTLEVITDLPRSQIVMYAGASGDFNPVHTDEVYVTRVAGHPTVFAHGMLTMGATGKVLTDWVGNGRLTSFGVRFVNLVRPGDTLTATATVEKLRVNETGRHVADFTVVTTNQDGLTVVTGQATAEIHT
ncbi:MaoC/PaaZ C-terminal domain-containing protein [Nocardia nova]|uniref:MaoC/PaaZ C-terminal domain-containing protein n=1 Tax=Nocardia nova TaxID=37330 RepID=UPI0007A4A771|nr:MaoC/PaaZ C-terminal domain-containing protein [Nocardia nova]